MLRAAGIIIDIGINSIDDYQEDKNIGKAIIGGTFDTVTDYGPITGTLLGVSIVAGLGALGVSVSATAGTFIIVGGFIYGTVMLTIDKFMKQEKEDVKEKIKSPWFE